MLSAYPAIFYKEGNGYSVVFPDLNYLATDGETLEQALAMSVDCLAGYLYSVKLDKEEVPTPSDLKAIAPLKVASELDTEAGEYFVNIVTVDVDEYAKAHFNKSIKKTLSIPEWLNREALDKGINFSQVLQEALVAKLRSL